MGIRVAVDRGKRKEAGSVPGVSLIVKRGSDFEELYAASFRRLLEQSLQPPDSRPILG